MCGMAGRALSAAGHTVGRRAVCRPPHCRQRRRMHHSRAPEVFLSAYTAKADVYSAGVTLFYLLARRYPRWDTEAEVHRLNPRAVRARVLAGGPAFDPAAQPFPRLSAELRDLLGRMLANEPQDRPTAVEALQARGEEEYVGWWCGARGLAGGRRPGVELGSRAGWERGPPTPTPPPPTPLLPIAAPVVCPTAGGRARSRPPPRRPRIAGRRVCAPAQQRLRGVRPRRVPPVGQGAPGDAEGAGVG